MNFSIFITKTVAIIIFSWILGLFMPWWGFVLVAFIAGALGQQSALLNFFSGLLGVGIYYFITALRIGTSDNFVFADKIASIFGEGLGTSLTSFGLMLISCAIFSLLGGLSSLSGGYITAPEGGLTLQERRRGKSKRLKLDL